MEGVKNRMTVSVARFVDRLMWELHRMARALLRRFGWFGGALLVCGLLSAGAWFVERDQARELAAMRASIAKQKAMPSQQPAAHHTDEYARLSAFENYLFAHEDIPFAVQELLTLAEKEGLKIQRGEYRPQVDAQGGFMRYRMTLPVKGDVQAVYRFMRAALRGQKALAMTSVQFRRERAESTEVEARIQWAVLTRLPGRHSWSMVSAGDALDGQR